MPKFYYEDARWPWRPDAILRRYKKQILRFTSPDISRDRQDDKHLRPARALDLGMGYGRNALWLAERGFEVEAWEMDGRYVAEARGEARRRGLPLGVRRGDFGGLEWARGDRTYEVIVISQALHQLKRSAALRVLRQAKAALSKGGRLFLLAKLTRDRHFQRAVRSTEWRPVAGEKNTLARVEPRGRREFHPGRRRRRWTLLSALTAGEIRRALRGLRLVHYREVVLRSDWEENAVVTHTVAEVVGVKK